MTTSVISAAPVEELAAAVRGDLILPADPGYDYDHVLVVDPDLAARRFDEGEFVSPLLAGQILRQLKIPVQHGHIDYSIGDAFDYVPMQLVAPMPGKGEQVGEPQPGQKRERQSGALPVHLESRLDIRFECLQMREDSARDDSSQFAVHAIQVGEQCQTRGERKYTNRVKDLRHR